MKKILFPLVLLWSQSAFAQNFYKTITGYQLVSEFKQDIPEEDRVINLLGQQVSFNSVRNYPGDLYILIGQDVHTVDTVVVAHPVINTSSHQTGTWHQLPASFNIQDPCDMPESLDSLFLNAVASNACQGSQMIALITAQTQQGIPLFSAASLQGNVPYINSFNHSVASELSLAFSSLGQSPARNDSMMIVTNYVFSLYPYDDYSPLNSKDIDMIADSLSACLITGNCGNQAHYLALVVNQLFPWWGVAVELSSNSNPQQQCNVSHTFAGIADTSGNIYALLDATINSVWTDSLTGEVLSLQKADSFLLSIDSAFRVIKRNAGYFGANQPQIGPFGSPCVVSVQYNVDQIQQLNAYFVQARPADSIYLITGPNPLFDDAQHTEIIKQHWQALGFPLSEWQDNLLVIRSGVCISKGVGLKIQNRYGFPVSQD